MQVTCVRGRARHGFDLELTLSWTALLPRGAVTGTAEVADASRTAVEDGELDVTVAPGTLQAADRAAVRKALAAVLLRELSALNKALAARAAAVTGQAA